MPQTSDVPQPIEILFDTNILQYYSVPNIQQNLDAFLRELVIDSSVKFAISQITLCELLSGANVNQETKASEHISAFKQYAIDDQALIMAARLTNLYKEEGVPDTQINIGDKIIAATSILTGCPILTANVNDFPRPYFVEKFRHLLTYQKGRGLATICLEILAPDIELIGRRLANRR